MATGVHHRFPYIDALRAVAAFLVIWLHVTEHFHKLPGQDLGSTPLILALATAVDTGRIGVLIFFFISGFVIPSSLKGDRSTGARTFVIRRFLRLYPLYWFSIPLAIASVWWAAGLSISARDIALNFTMVQELFGAPNIQGLYWTLRIELYFYLACLVLFLMHALRRDWVIGLLAAGLLPMIAASQFVQHQKIFFWEIWAQDIHYLALMFTGALWRRFCEGQISKFALGALFASTSLFLIVFPILALVDYWDDAFIHPDRAHLFVSYSLATLIFTLGVTCIKGSWRWLTYLGLISYSLYLLHPVVLYTLYWAIDRLPITSALRSLPLSTYLVVVAAGSVALSAMTYRFLEEPLIRLGVRLTASRAQRPSASDETI